MRILMLLFLCSCSLMFGGKDSPKSAKNSQYTLNFKGPDWQARKDDRSDYVLENKDGRILISNSFCEEFQDLPLDVLAKKTFRTVSEYKTLTGEFTTFHNREAYRLDGHGLVDGVKVSLKILNTRRNNCYFDFVSISPFQLSETNNADFDKFLNSVEFK